MFCDGGVDTIRCRYSMYVGTFSKMESGDFPTLFLGGLGSDERNNSMNPPLQCPYDSKKEGERKEKSLSKTTRRAHGKQSTSIFGLSMD